MPAADIRAGGAYVELSSRDTRFVKGMRRAQMRLQRFGASVQAVGSALARFSAMAAVPLILITKKFAEFTDKMSEVRAVAGATVKDFERLTEQAKELGRTTSFTASQVAGAMAELGRAGFKTAEIQASIASILDLARGTSTELPMAAEIAAAALRGFNMDASETTRIADVLTATANNSAQRLEDLGESLKYVAPFASEAGESIEDTATALAVLANFGVKGSMAGTSLRRAFLQLSKADVREMLEGIGVQAVDADGNLRKIAQVFFEIGKATETMGTGERLAIFDKLFGARGVIGALKVGMSVEAFKELNEAVTNSAGAASRTAKIMDDNLGGTLRRLWSAIEGVVLAVGEALRPEFEKIGKILTDVAGKITRWVKFNKAAIINAVKLAAKIAALGAAFMAAAMAIKVVGLALSIFTPTGAIIVGVLALVAGMIKLREAIVGTSKSYREMKEDIKGALAEQNKLAQKADEAHIASLRRGIERAKAEKAGAVEIERRQRQIQRVMARGTARGLELEREDLVDTIQELRWGMVSRDGGAGKITETQIDRYFLLRKQLEKLEDTADWTDAHRKKYEQLTRVLAEPINIRVADYIKQMDGLFIRLDEVGAKLSELRATGFTSTELRREADRLAASEKALSVAYKRAKEKRIATEATAPISKEEARLFREWFLIQRRLLDVKGAIDVAGRREGQKRQREWEETFPKEKKAVRPLAPEQKELMGFEKRYMEKKAAEAKELRWKEFLRGKEEKAAKRNAGRLDPIFDTIKSSFGAGTDAVREFGWRMRDAKGPVVEKLEEQARAVPAILAQQLAAAGTFSGVAAQMMGAGPAAQNRLLDASEETAANTKKLVRQAQSGGLTFS